MKQDKGKQSRPKRNLAEQECHDWSVAVDGDEEACFIRSSN